ncbi:MAG: DNA recombination/repair protein RecA [Bryobacterales bacterium]|nr:DNA recombination/repair protein RecA [Bryobacterales bacterium]
MNFFPSLPQKPSGEAIPTGLEGVDAMLGTGGLPRGRVVEVFGAADCGKTTIALNWVAAAQTRGATAVYVDAERKLDTAWAKAAGVNLEDLIVLRPDTGPEAIGMVESLLRTFTIDLVVVDSAAALVSGEELEAAIENAPAELHTEFLSRSLRRLNNLIERGRCSLLFVNQLRLREREEIMETSSGSRALALYAAIRIRISQGPALSEGGRVVGAQLHLTTVKNKLAEPFAEAGIELRGARVSMSGRKAPEREAPQRKAARVGTVR